MGAQDRPKIPLHEQLYRDLRQRIDNGGWGPGHQIPSEVSLAEEFGVSRGTTRQAIARLVTDGLVDRTAGRGTFVSSRRLHYPLAGLLGFTEQVTSEGHSPSSRVVQLRDQPADSVPFAFGDRVTRVLSIERVRLSDGEPVALEQLLLPLPRFAGFREMDLSEASVYETLEQHFAVQIRFGDFTLQIDTLDSRKATLLDVDPGTAAFMMTGTVFDQSQHTVMGVRCCYRKDRYSFRFSMPRPATAGDTSGTTQLVLNEVGNKAEPFDAVASRG
ncbi:GntR family transcriptional regulator [Tsukamurella soli]|uniref:Transcriptional regulator NagR n=1 Tax=Tsukamurella soli TaxID=644556 RepID=A0ABP8KCS0_9ACTN